jgi:preprotein translocase subunit YajC
MAIDEDDDLMLEIAPGTQVRIARRAVAAVVPPDEETPALEEGKEMERDEEVRS